MSQPTWKLLRNLGDVNPIDHGGYFVYTDITGVYAPEAEALFAPDSDDAPEGWTIYRFPLERCTWINGILSDNSFHPEMAAWWANPEAERATRPQDTTYLSNLAQFTGLSLLALVSLFISEDPILRADGYRIVGQYHGFDNLDSYPITLHNRADVEARYEEKNA